MTMTTVDFAGCNGDKWIGKTYKDGRCGDGGGGGETSVGKLGKGCEERIVCVDQCLTISDWTIKARAGKEWDGM